jgi:hypothetical protein
LNSTRTGSTVSSRISADCGQLGITIEFTRKVGRGFSTFQVEFDCDSLDELASAIEASHKAAKRESSVHINRTLK